MRTRSEHAEQPCPAWGWLQARPPASPARPGRILGPGSFPLPTETLQDWAPWAKMPCPGKRQEEHLRFPLGPGRVCAMAAFTYNFICVLLYFTFTGKTLSQPRTSTVFSTSGWQSAACLNCVWKVIDRKGCPGLGLFFVFVFIF